MRAIAMAAVLMAPLPVLASELAEEDRPPESVLVFVAHPDDEIFFAPALAAKARQGADVTIVYATRGDVGPGVSEFAPGEALAAARSEEARCSSRALGLNEPVLLDHGDGTLGIAAHRAEGSAGALASDIARLVEEYTPDTIITWGPDGGYGHADHRMVGALVTTHLQAFPAPRPQLLYPAVRSGSLPDVPQMQAWAQTDPSLIGVSVEYDENDLSAAAAAANCHLTQFDEATRATIAPLFGASIWQGGVAFRSAFGLGD